MPDLQITIANQITTSAAQSTLSIQEVITNMRTAGMSDLAIRQTLLNDLNTGGPLFGTFRNKIKNTVKNGVELSSNDRATNQFKEAGIKMFQWVSVGDGKVCPDCADRHGEVGTLDSFETIGLPASGFSVCTTNCRCQLIPESYKGENLDKPLVKKKIQKPLYENVKQAENYIAKKLNLSDNKVSFNGLEMDAINDATEAVEEIYKKTGLKFWAIKTVTKNRGWSAAYSRFGNELKLNTRNARSNTVYKTKAKKLDDIYNKRIIGSEKTISELKEKLKLSPNKSLSLELKRIENELNELKKFSRNNVANNIKEVIYHESGHGIQAGRHLPQEQVMGWRKRINKAAANGYNSEWKYKISRYGAETNDILGSQTMIGSKDKYGEFIAESFCAYMKGEKANIYPELLKLFDEVVGK